MPTPTIRRPPAELSAGQALGSFLDRFDSAGVVLVCHQGGQDHFFGQWADEQGLGHVLRWCRTLGGPGFTRLWLGEEPAKSTGPTPAPGEAPAAAQPRNLAGLSDETLLRHFMRTVDCTAALLVYLGEEFAIHAFWRWRDKAGAQWARAAWAEKRLWCPLWDDADLLGGQLCPATYAATIQAAGHAHRATTQARALAWGWGPEVGESCNRLNG